MAQRDVATVRRIFFRALLRGVRILWPALSGVPTAIMSLGALVGLLEGWGIAQGVYFGSSLFQVGRLSSSLPAMR
jgi:hypothetical protein